MKASLTCFSIGALVALSASSSATLLHFDGLGLANYGDIPSNLGSFASTAVTGVSQGSAWTPNVAVSMSSVLADGSLGASNLDFWNTSYGDLTDVAFPVSSGWFGRVKLTADPGFLVTINSFDLGGYPGTNLTASRIRIYNSLGNVVWNQDGTTVIGAGPSHSSYAPAITDSTLTLEYGDNWNIGLDNLNFTQSVPVPEPLSISALALGGLALLKRRKKS